jgi:hypothetical protein
MDEKRLDNWRQAKRHFCDHRDLLAHRIADLDGCTTPGQLHFEAASREMEPQYLEIVRQHLG